MLIESMGVIGGFLTPVFSLDMQGYCVYSSYTLADDFRRKTVSVVKLVCFIHAISLTDWSIS